MSTTRQHIIWCDEATCTERIVVDERQLGGARKKARKAGWECSAEAGRFGMVLGRDYCPKHKTESA